MPRTTPHNRNTHSHKGVRIDNNREPCLDKKGHTWRVTLGRTTGAINYICTKCETVRFTYEEPNETG